MHKRSLAAALVAVAAFLSARPARAADEATLLRVFLKDGSSLVSYGEPALVSDRVVFSMPAASTPNPPLHLVDLPLARVDWDRTTRYATSARATHYLQTRADADYAALSADVAQTLSEIAAMADPQQRIAVVERARRTLAEWPQSHFNYRQAEVRQMISMLDEAIADLRASTGARRFDLALSAFVDPPAIVEPPLPPPTLQESIEQFLTAARTVDHPAERVSLLATAVAAIDASRPNLPADWAAKTRLGAETGIRAEQRIDRSYNVFATRYIRLADTRAHLADVRGVERLLHAVSSRDTLLGGKRPDTVAALITAIEEKLDAARRLQLARDRWALRAPAFVKYQLDIAPAMALFGELKPALERIKSVAGSTPAGLAAVERSATKILGLAAAISPPSELAAAHALIVSAAQLAANAATIRREAVLAEDMTGAWNASSAAAGALMLVARAQSDIRAVVRRPQLRSVTSAGRPEHVEDR